MASAAFVALFLDFRYNIIENILNSMIKYRIAEQSFVCYISGMSGNS